MTRFDDTRGVTAADALARLPGEQGERSRELFRHGNLQLKVYAPVGSDPQTPHTLGRPGEERARRRVTMGPKASGSARRS